MLETISNIPSKSSTFREPVNGPVNTNVNKSAGKGLPIIKNYIQLGGKLWIWKLIIFKYSRQFNTFLSKAMTNGKQRFCHQVDVHLEASVRPLCVPSRLFVASLPKALSPAIWGPSNHGKGHTHTHGPDGSWRFGNNARTRSPECGSALTYLSH